MATEQELEKLDEKYAALMEELDVVLKKYDATLQSTYEGGQVFFNGTDHGNRAYYV